MKRKNWYIALALVGFIISASLIQRFVKSSQLLEQGTSYLLYPLLVMQNNIVSPIKDFLHKRHSLMDIDTKYQALMAEYNNLLQENIALSASLSYYSNIKELVSFQQRYMHNNGVIAHIILKNLNDQSHYAFVDVGSRHGISDDMVAIYNNCIVGRVIETFPLYSKIMLITDKNCKVAVYCAKTKTYGIYQGANNPTLSILDKVSHLDAINDGDLLLSSGQGLVFPQGFGVGKIKDHYPMDLFHNITIEPLFNVETINYCMIIPHKTKL